MVLIELKNVSKFYSSESNVALGIRHVNASFSVGEFVAVTGSSGSGKSTLLNVLSGIDSFEEGEFFLRGQNVTHFVEQDRAKYREKDVAFIFQDYNIIDSYTVEQNVELALLSRYPDNVKRKQKINEILAKVGLTNRRRHRGSKLSGGEKQRVSIARALAKDAPILFADEPTGNLDSQTGAEIISILGEIAKDRLVIIVTHSFDEVSQYATRILRLDDGMVVEDRVLVATKDMDEPKVTELADMSFKQKSKNLFRVALYNLFATPKKSLFLTTGIVILILAVMYVLGNVFSALGKETYQNGRHFSDIDVKTINGQTLTAEELATIKGITGVLNVYSDKSLLNTTASNFDNVNHVYVPSSIFKEDYYTLSASVRPCNAEYLMLADGRMPQKKGEIVLSLYKGEQNKNILNSKVSFSFSSYNENTIYTIENYEKKLLSMREYTIVGYCFMETYNYTVYMLPEDIEYESLINSNAATIVTDNSSNIAIENVLKQLNKGNIKANYPYGLKMSIESIIMKLASIVLIISLICIGYVMICLVLSKSKTIGETKKKDYNIMRTVGLTNSFIKSTYYLEMILNACFSFVLAIAIGLIYVATDKPPAVSYGSYLGHILVGSNSHLLLVTIFAFLISLLLVLSIARKFNQKFFSLSVKSSLMWEAYND